jgi:hypothetical protein
MPCCCHKQLAHKKDTVFNSMNNETLGEDALEMIMRDVLEGLQDFTRQANPESKRDNMENGYRKKKSSARIIHFPRPYPTS